MKLIKMLSMSAVALVAISGCATVQQSPSRSDAAAPVETVNASASLEDGQTLGALPQATIPTEECGMILWTVSSQRPTPVFRFISGKQGEIQLGGKILSLDLINVNGDSGFGVFEEQVFQSSEGLIVEVSANFGVGFAGGAYLEEGVIRMRDASGWSAVTPAAGVAGCR